MIPTEWWGTAQPYESILARQVARRERVLAGEPAQVLALLEHTAVVTTGRRAVVDLPDHIPVVKTERGGLATWHGPGQLVGYLIADLRPIGVRCAVQALEQGLMDWIGAQGVDAGRRKGHPGVWCRLGKLAAIGLHLKRGVSIHGFSLNLQVPQESWRGIVPCGIQDARPASLDELTMAPHPVDCWRSVGEAIVSSLTAQLGSATYGGP